MVEVVERAERTSCVGEQGSAGRGELDPARASFEQLGADQGFQAAEALRQRRLGDPDDAGCVAEVLLVGERDKDLEVPLSQHDPADLRRYHQQIGSCVRAYSTWPGRLALTEDHAPGGPEHGRRRHDG
jgi:hypothetical protein